MAGKRRPPSDVPARRAEAQAVPSRRVTWKATWRLVPSRFPPIDLFERVAPREEWETLYALEALTNPRIRDEVGNIRLVPAERRVTGPGASVVMAPFTHASRSRPSRFTDGSFGIYYAARAFDTALLEVAFHMGRFHAATSDPPLTATYRAYKGSINKALHDIRGADHAHLLSPDPADYPRSQAFAKVLRDAGSNGLVYPSVRHPRGQCIAAFWPDVVAIPVQDRHVQMTWDGRRMAGWLEYRAEAVADPPQWQPWPG